MGKFTSDLISRRELKESLIYCNELGRKSFEAVINVIDEQPVINAMSKIYGVWETVPCRNMEHGNIVSEGTVERCSNCRKASKYYQKDMNFCPNCSAIMRSSKSRSIEH